jgi:NMD protein affecting ribosome stability and mRNA decay
MKHCPICNRSSAEVRFYGEFCEEHAAKKLKEKLVSEVPVIVCRDCGRMKVAGKFVPENKENMQRLLASVYKPYLVSLINSGNGIARIIVRDESHYGIEVEHNAHLKFERILCDDDIRKRGGYYEAVVQFRGEIGKVSRAAASLQRYLEDNGAFVTRVEEKEYGVDIFTSDKEAVVSFITARHFKWKGSFELHGEKRGRRLYRNTYFITL